MAETSVSVHRYRDRILVEVIDDGGSGDVDTTTVECDLVDLEAGVISPRTELPAEYEAQIREGLQQSEYTLADREVTQ